MFAARFFRRFAVVVLISALAPLLYTTPASAAPVEYFGEQIGCPPTRACNPILLRIDDETGQFRVIKGPAVSCSGTTDPTSLTFFARCDPNRHNFIGGIAVREAANGDLNFVLWKLNPRTGNRMTVRAALSIIVG